MTPNYGKSPVLPPDDEYPRIVINYNGDMNVKASGGVINKDELIANISKAIGTDRESVQKMKQGTFSGEPNESVSMGATSITPDEINAVDHSVPPYMTPEQYQAILNKAVEAYWTQFNNGSGISGWTGYNGMSETHQAESLHQTVVMVSRIVAATILESRNVYG